MKIEDLRKKTDSIDEKMVALLNDRCKIVADIGKLKMNADRKIYVPEREKFILDRLEKINNGLLSSKALRAIYREIMSASIALEKPLQIAYFGQKASFTHLASYAKFGHAAEYVSKTTIADVFNDVDADRMDYGVIPIENSTEGVVNHTLDMLMNSSSKICAEINMRIHQCLLSKYSISNIRKIYSHAQCFGQCRAWLQEHMSGVETVEVSSTTKAAELASREKHSAAISSSFAAKIYGLKPVAEKIEDNPYNTTRFLVIGKQDP
nr:chorismate mutase [Victivallales bacterium]